jgi:hypothetical protein
VRSDFDGWGRHNHLVIVPCNITHRTVRMADNDALAISGDIDMDRVIIDPDYRRMVIAMLRQTRSRSEPDAAGTRAAEPLPATLGIG